MDVDGEADQGEEDNDDNETEDNEDDDEAAGLYLDEDDDGAGEQGATKKTKNKNKKSKKGLSRRKSELNMQVALEKLEGNEVLRLRLHKKYCAEALTFIRLVEGAMDVIGQLLGSTNKAEVLEAMEFFRTAYEYQLDGVAVGYHFLSWHTFIISLSPGWHQEDATSDLV
jgi:condensin complex subunit 1